MSVLENKYNIFFSYSYLINREQFVQIKNNNNILYFHSLWISEMNDNFIRDGSEEVETLCFMVSVLPIKQYSVN